MSTIQVYDLISHCPNPVSEAFMATLDDLEKQSHDKLKANYASLRHNYQSYPSFIVLMENDRCIAFSGLQTAGYHHAARALSRTYYVPEVRTSNLKPREFPGLASRYMLQPQVQKAKDLGLHHVFVSFEAGRLKQGLFPQKFAENLRRLWPEQNWQLLPQTYNTCRRLPDQSLNQHPSCRQHVICLSLTDSPHDFPLPHGD